MLFQEPRENINALAVALDYEETELRRQLSRKTDFERRVFEKLYQLQDLRDRRRKLGTANSQVAASVEHLSDELAFMREQEEEAEKDIAQLKAAAEREGKYQNDHRDPQAILAEEKRRQETVVQQQEKITQLRGHLERLRAEKANLMPRQQILFEKQRSAEQDRNRLLGTLQDDRSAINEVRQERIRLMEERTRLEKQLFELSNGGAGESANVAPSSPSKTNLIGYQSSGGQAPVRSHWSSTPDQQPQSPPQQTQQQQFGSPSSMARFATTSGYPGAGGQMPYAGSPMAYNTAPMQASRRDEDVGAGGISEWADRLRGSRAASTRAF